MRKIINILVIIILLVSCRNIVVYKTEFSDDFIIKEGQHFEMFYYPGKDSYAEPSEYSQEKERFYKDYYLTSNNVDVSFEKELLIYKFKNGLIDTLTLEKGKFMHKKYFLPFNFHLDPGIVSNQMYVNKIDSELTWVVTYKGDSIHYFNNQKPIKTYIFNYYPYRAEDIYEDYTEPITYHISSVDGMVVAVDYSYENFFISHVNDTSETQNLMQMRMNVKDYKVFNCSKRKLKKYLF